MARSAADKVLSAGDLGRRPEKLGRKIGILGGTFDPIHKGHLVMAEAVKDAFALHSLLFIPASQPPHKSHERISPFADRVRMVELAIAARPGFFATTIEGERPGPSYSVDTLRELHRLLGRVQLFFLIGMDAFADLGSWKEHERLLELAELVVLDRPPFRGDFLAQAVGRLFPSFRFDPALHAWVGSSSGRIHLFDIEPVHVSATAVRNQAKAGQPVGDLVPAPVAEYIQRHHLYS